MLICHNWISQRALASTFFRGRSEIDHLLFVHTGLDDTQEPEWWCHPTIIFTPRKWRGQMPMTVSVTWLYRSHGHERMTWRQFIATALFVSVFVYIYVLNRIFSSVPKGIDSECYTVGRRYGRHCNHKIHPFYIYIYTYTILILPNRIRRPWCIDNLLYMSFLTKWISCATIPENVRFSGTVSYWILCTVDLISEYPIFKWVAMNWLNDYIQLYYYQ